MDCFNNSNPKIRKKVYFSKKKSLLVKLIFTGTSSKIAFTSKKCLLEQQFTTLLKMWNASRFCVSSLRRGHANLLCIVPILVYVQPRLVHCPHSDHHYCCGNCNAMIEDKKKFGKNSLFKNYWITAQGLLKWLAGRLACSYNPATWEARTWTGMRRGVLIALDSCWIGVRTKASINMAL